MTGIRRSLRRAPHLPSLLLLVSTVLATSVAVFVADVPPAQADDYCHHETGVFPTATAPPPFSFRLINGDSGMLQRYLNNFPAVCTGSQQNDYAVNLSVDYPNVYIETGMLEVGFSSGGHTYQLFMEVYLGNGVYTLLSSPYTRCGYSLFPADLGYSTVRVYRYWASTWAAEIDCNNNGVWTATDYYTFSHSYSWGFGRSEFSRHSDGNSYAMYWSRLQTRDITTGLWSDWTGMACVNPGSLTNANVDRFSGNSWNLVPGSGAC
jgi:hypothetical protein